MTLMIAPASGDRLRLDLAAARRAGTMITDPLSARTIDAYISELEKELRRMEADFSTDWLPANEATPQRAT